MNDINRRKASMKFEAASLTHKPLVANQSQRSSQ
jgi:hypothetical protein